MLFTVLGLTEETIVGLHLKKIVFRIINLMCTFCMLVCLCTVCVPAEARRVHRSPLKLDCEPPRGGAGNQGQILWKRVNAVNHWATSPDSPSLTTLCRVLKRPPSHRYFARPSFTPLALSWQIWWLLATCSCCATEIWLLPTGVCWKWEQKLWTFSREKENVKYLTNFIYFGQAQCVL